MCLQVYLEHINTSRFIVKQTSDFAYVQSCSCFFTLHGCLTHIRCDERSLLMRYIGLIIVISWQQKSNRHDSFTFANKTTPQNGINNFRSLWILFDLVEVKSFDACKLTVFSFSISKEN
jgi:hypothetical protein